jgi:hypothetical protein
MDANTTMGAGLRPGWFLTLVLVGLVAGCATAKIDWKGRVGQYTCDQAILEFGPPDKQATLADGTRVAEWLTARGYRYTYVTPGYGFPHWWCGPYYPTYLDSYSPNYYLRLVFGPDGRLKEWKKFAR